MAYTVSRLDENILSTTPGLEAQLLARLYTLQGRSSPVVVEATLRYAVLPTDFEDILYLSVFNQSDNGIERNAESLRDIFDA